MAAAFLGGIVQNCVKFDFVGKLLELGTIWQARILPVRNGCMGTGDKAIIRDRSIESHDSGRWWQRWFCAWEGAKVVVP